MFTLGMSARVEAPSELGSDGLDVDVLALELAATSFSGWDTDSAKAAVLASVAAATRQDAAQPGPALPRNTTNPLWSGRTLATAVDRVVVLATDRHLDWSQARFLVARDRGERAALVQARLRFVAPFLE